MTKSEVKSLLVKAAKDLGFTDADAWKQQGVHQFATARVVLDAAGVKDPETRKKAYLALKNAHSGFGCNASQMHQWVDKIDKVEQAVTTNVAV